MTTSQHAFVVAVDGSDSAQDAASWASTEAVRRHAPVHLVIVNDDPTREDYAEKALRETGQKCRRQAPSVDVTEELVVGHPIEELLRRSTDAQLMVLGSRGHGGFADALLGSVSTAVATHAACPVVVVRGNLPAATGPVVVGLDNSAGSRAALRFAVHAAANRRTELVALQAWHEEGLLSAPLPAPDREQIQQQIERSLDEQLAGWNTQYPDLGLRRLVQHGHPVAALTDASRDAQLLVVGHRGRGGFAGLLLGSVAAGVLHHAHCPVAVVRSP